MNRPCLIYALLAITIVPPIYGKIPQLYLNHQFHIKIYQHIEKKQYDSALLYTNTYYRQKVITQKEHLTICAKLHFLSQQYNKAARKYTTLILQSNHKKEQQEYLLKTAQSYAAISKDSLAYHYLQKYLQNSPKKREYLIKSDSLFNKLKHQYQWEQLWKTEHYSNADLVSAELHWLDSRHQYEELIYYYQSVADSLIYINADNQYLYAKALYNLKSLQSAIHELEQMNQKKEYHSQALQLLISIYKEKKQYKELLTAAHLLLKTTPYLYQPYFEIAKALYHLKKYKESQEYLTFYQPFDNGNQEVKWLQILLAYQRKEYNNVLENISILIQNNYQLEETLLLRAQVYWLTDLSQYALQDIVRRTTLKPLTDKEIVKYILQFEDLQDKKSYCILLQSAKTNINPDIEKLRKKYCNKKRP